MMSSRDVKGQNKCVTGVEWQQTSGQFTDTGPDNVITITDVTDISCNVDSLKNKIIYR